MAMLKNQRVPPTYCGRHPFFSPEAWAFGCILFEMPLAEIRFFRDVHQVQRGFHGLPEFASVHKFYIEELQMWTWFVQNSWDFLGFQCLETHFRDTVSTPTQVIYQSLDSTSYGELALNKLGREQKVSLVSYKMSSRVHRQYIANKTARWLHPEWLNRNCVWPLYISGLRCGHRSKWKTPKIACENIPTLPYMSSIPSMFRASFWMFRIEFAVQRP